MKIYILSGGKSSRMGEDKGLKLLNGKPVISYLIDSLKKTDFEIFIIAHHSDYKQFNLPLISDIIEGKGPIGGIFTALSHAQEDVFVLSADTPFITQENILILKNEHKKGNITLAYSEEKIYPLFAIYPFQIIENIKKCIEKEHLKLMQFLEGNTIHKVNLKLSPLEKININTKEDLEIAEKFLKNGNQNLWENYGNN